MSICGAHMSIFGPYMVIHEPSMIMDDHIRSIYDHVWSIYDHIWTIYDHIFIHLNGVETTAIRDKPSLKCSYMFHLRLYMVCTRALVMHVRAYVRMHSCVYTCIPAGVSTDRPRAKKLNRYFSQSLDPLVFPSFP